MRTFSGTARATAGLAVVIAVVATPPSAPPAVAATPPAHASVRTAGSLSVTPSAPIVGEDVVFRGSVPARTRRVVLLQQWTGRVWATRTKGRTSTRGAFRLSARAPRTTTRAVYRVHAPAGTFGHRYLRAATTPTVAVRARNQRASLTGPDTVVTRAPVTLTASFTPARRGREVLVERADDSGWTTVATTHESAAGVAVYAGSAPDSAGDVSYRAVAVASHGAKSVSASHVLVATATWRAPTLVSKSVGDLLSVSCVSLSWCLASDWAGNVVTYDGTGWSVPQTLPGHLYVAGVSCTSTTFCVAVDEVGEAMTYDGQTWSAPVPVSTGHSPLLSVSCASVARCATVSLGGDAFTFDGTSWTGPTSLGGPVFATVSCADASHCVALNDLGEAYGFDGTTWSPPTQLPGSDGTDEQMSLSCPTSDFCMAVGDAGDAYTYDGMSWTALAAPASLSTVLGGSGVSRLSCSGSTYCMVETTWGATATWNGSDWGAEEPTGHTGAGAGGLACVSDAFCVSLGDASASTFDGTGWVKDDGVDPTAGGFGSVSCLSPTFCIAADNDGRVSRWDGSTWTAPVLVDDHGGATSISCGSESLCVLVDDSGHATTYSGTSWEDPVAIDTQGLRSVSCPAQNVVELLCVAVGDSGRDHDLVPGGWAGGGAVTSRALTDISCVSSAWCMAVDDEGNVFTDESSVWSDPESVHSAAEVLGLLSCATVDFCAGVADDDSWTYDGGSWVSSGPMPRPGERTRQQDLSCGSPTYCVAVGPAGTETYDGTGWTYADVGLGDGLTGISCPTASFCAAVDRWGNARVYN